jgi:hypothetical protein
LIEAREQVEHGEWGAWLKVNFAWSRGTAHSWMKAAEKAQSSKRVFSALNKTTLSEITRPDRDPQHRAAWHEPVRLAVNKLDVERLAQERQSREREAKLVRALGLQLIDIGYKVLAQKPPSCVACADDGTTPLQREVTFAPDLLKHQRRNSGWDNELIVPTTLAKLKQCEGREVRLTAFKIGALVVAAYHFLPLAILTLIAVPLAVLGVVPASTAAFIVVQATLLWKVMEWLIGADPPSSDIARAERPSPDIPPSDKVTTPAATTGRLERKEPEWVLTEIPSRIPLAAGWVLVELSNGSRTHHSYARKDDDGVTLTYRLDSGLIIQSTPQTRSTASPD